MVQEKKMDAAGFAKLVKELDSVGELILSRQNEKQSVMDDFEKEKARYTSGKISEDTLNSSAKKVNVELLRLDKSIREAIVRVGKLSAQLKEFAGRQSPKVFRASTSGLKMLNSPARKQAAEKKAAAKRKPVPLRTVLEKEKTLDLKFSKK